MHPREGYPGWTSTQLAYIDTVESFGAMADFAIAMLGTLPKPIFQVCGPITTGGRGSFEENIKALDFAIHHLRAQGKAVFDQQPYQPAIQRLKANGYPYALLEEFYLPIFRSGHITGFYFLPDWQSSQGARWEHERGLELCMRIEYLPESLFLAG